MSDTNTTWLDERAASWCRSLGRPTREVFIQALWEMEGSPDPRPRSSQKHQDEPKNTPATSKNAADTLTDEEWQRDFHTTGLMQIGRVHGGRIAHIFIPAQQSTLCKKHHWRYWFDSPKPSGIHRNSPICQECLNRYRVAIAATVATP